jgi:hypothetical protein
MDRRPPGIPLEVDEDQQAARKAGAARVDAVTAERIRKSLANPRPPSPAAEAFARVDARIAEYKAKRGA